MTRYTPLHVQAGGGDTAVQFTGLDLRLGTQSAWATEGVITGLDVSQRAAGANFSVDVAAGQAIITGNDVAVQGTYVVTSDAVENIAVPTTLPPSGSRVHRVVAYVRDHLFDAGLAANTYDFVFTVLEDTGSGTPPAPPSAITLALITVTPSTTSILTGNIAAAYIHALGRPGRGRLAADAAARPPVPLIGERLLRQDLADEEVWDGTAWRLVGLTAPYAILTATADQSLATATNASVAFDSEVVDSHNGHSTSSNNSRYTAPRAGLYRAYASVPWVNNTASGKFETWFRVNGTTEWSGSSTEKGTNNVTTISSASALLQLNAGDYVEVRVWQGTGGTRAIDHSYKGGPRFEIHWLRSL
ncbi:hypothetical protein [Actinomadura litoris]|uniref:hypothetical protein n=1 Tax=Actinomadura litoris TaxID=2678616 RepID=UPI001FA7EF35|nr:hypothetical protein [Actinomadura litoris]